jgi:hypothetical protein
VVRLVSGVYPEGVEVRRYASISDDGMYRFGLVRDWSEENNCSYLTFIMLNPSTADAELDDPTIRRCVGFAVSLGFNAVRVLNLYAFRATKPSDLWRAAEPTGGPRNDDLLREVGRQAPYGNPMIAAWGVHTRADRVAEVLSFPGWDQLAALGMTKAGAPRHPLYLPSTAQMTPWPEHAVEHCTFKGCGVPVEATHNPCCSSHGRPLCCEHYCYTHFVQANPCSPETHRTAAVA